MLRIALFALAVAACSSDHAEAPPPPPPVTGSGSIDVTNVSATWSTGCGASPVGGGGCSPAGLFVTLTPVSANVDVSLTSTVDDASARVTIAITTTLGPAVDAAAPSAEVLNADPADIPFGKIYTVDVYDNGHLVFTGTIDPQIAS